MTRSTQPTARQRAYLVFIRTFTDRWGVPPSFTEIGRHFETTPPSVNSMVKMLEARGFLARVPHAPRTLRVLLSSDELEDPATHTGSARPERSSASAIDSAVRMAGATIERLVPVLRGVDPEQLNDAIGAVVKALDVTLRGAGASDDQRRAADDAVVRVACIAQGDSTETRPGRSLPWWRRPRPR